MKGNIEIFFGEKAISRQIGNFEELTGQLDLSHKGSLQGSFEQKLIIASGDVLCDLISGEAKMVMSYPIENEEKVIRVDYMPVEVRLL